jgi:hypothetical protein
MLRDAIEDDLGGVKKSFEAITLSRSGRRPISEQPARLLTMPRLLYADRSPGDIGRIGARSHRAHEAANVFLLLPTNSHLALQLR